MENVVLPRGNNHLIIFFKSTLTIPKIKDLINTSNQKYQNIYDTISHNSSGQSYTSIDLLPKTNDKNDINDINAINDIKGINVNGINVNGNGINVGKNAMKDELKSFLKKQLNNNNDNDNDVIGFDSSNSFSNF
jgi:hypothetical protein